MRITLIPPISAVLLALAAPGALAADTGGAASSATPRPQSVSCSESCAELAAARAGSIVRVYGKDLAQVAEVTFLGRKGNADDVSATPTKSRSHTVYVRVPPGAASGPLVLTNVDGTASESGPSLTIDRAAGEVTGSSTHPPVDAQVESRKTFFDGRRPAALNYLVKGGSPTRVAVMLVRAGSETVVARWSPGTVKPGTAMRVRWNGMDANTRATAARGRYEFRVYTATATGARAASAAPKPSAAQSFMFLDHQFPIRGRHQFGDGGARFGAGRAGHIHQGQDVFAKCGTPLVAARGGKVKFAGYQSRAGNYIVIDGARTGVDYAYMHLAAPALFHKNATVRTGDRIGDVGDTGDASACHLHFEEWSAPGWYTGGAPFDPLPSLRAWDRFS